MYAVCMYIYTSTRSTEDSILRTLFCYIYNKQVLYLESSDEQSVIVDGSGRKIDPPNIFYHVWSQIREKRFLG